MRLQEAPFLYRCGPLCRLQAGSSCRRVDVHIRAKKASASLLVLTQFKLKAAILHHTIPHIQHKLSLSQPSHNLSAGG